MLLTAIWLQYNNLWLAQMVYLIGYAYNKKAAANATAFYCITHLNLSTPHVYHSF
jgi:hypothetical protein